MDSVQCRLNPWFSMWIKPRATIQQIVDENPTRFVILITVVTGISHALDQVSAKSLGDHLDPLYLFLLVIAVGSIAGIISLYLGGLLIRWTGSWIGGTGSAQHIRAAMAWSSVPLVWGLILWVPELALFGAEMFTSETPTIDANPMLMKSFWFFVIAGAVIGIWSLVLLFKCLGQVQGFSAWRAMANLILALLLFFTPFVAVIAALVAIMR